MSEPSEIHVLIVEDSPDLRSLMRLALVKAGVRVSTAADGREAMSFLETTPPLDRPRLILLDLMMPIMSGWEFLESRRANAELSRIPVVVLSAVRDGLPLAVKCLTKPIELPVLLATVRDNYAR